MKNPNSWTFLIYFRWFRIIYEKQFCFINHSWWQIKTRILQNWDFQRLSKTLDVSKLNQEKTTGKISMIKKSRKKFTLFFYNGLYNCQYFLTFRSLIGKILSDYLTFRFRYTDRSYRHHPRGLIIYGPVTVSSILGNNNATLLWGGKDNSNFSKLDGDDSIRNTYFVGSSQESLTANSTNNTVIPRCPLVSPHLSKLYALYKFAPMPD